MAVLPAQLCRAAEAAEEGEEVEDSSEVASGHKVVVLDPVDLEGETPIPEWGLGLRGVFASLPGWAVVHDDTLKAKLKQYGKNPAAPCHAFQCAFDAGTFMLAEFAVFGTITLVEGWYAYTLDIVEVASAQPVWTKVGEIKVSSGPRPGGDLARHLRETISRLKPDSLKAARRRKRGSLTILDLGEGSTVSRVVVERMATRLHATRSFTLMNQAEQDELLDALEIDKADFAPTDSGLLWLGGKMGVSHLVLSQLAKKDPGYRLGMAYYDMEENRKVLDRPALPAPGFPDVLRLEDGFFADLFTPLEVAPRSEDTERLWFRVGAGGALGVSIATGVMAALVDDTAAKWTFGGISAVFLAGSGLSLYLSF